MRIAINTRMLISGRMEGIGWYTYEVVRRLLQSHPEDTFILFFDRPWDAAFVFGPNVIPVRVWPPARHPVLFKIWFDYRLPSLLKKYKADVFFSPDGFLSLRTAVPTLLTIHDLAWQHLPDDIPGHWLRYYRDNVPRFIEKAAFVTTVSEATRQDVLATGKNADRVHVGYNGADPRFQPDDSQDIRKRYTDGEPYFLYVGAIHPRKNIARLIRAFDRFKSDTGLSHRLILLGRTAWMAEDVRTAIASARHSEHILHIGYQGDLLPAFYTEATALVYVSLFEGFGLPILEAMQCDTPVITSDRSSMPEVSGDAALLVDPTDTEAIAGAMARVAGEPDLSAGMVVRGRIVRTRFSWDQTAGHIWDLLCRMVRP